MANKIIFKEIIYYILVITIVCFICSHNMTANNVDVASHYTLVDKINRDFSINSGYIENLGEMADYPPFSHYAAAFINKITGSGLISMNVVDILILAVGWIVIAKIILETGVLALILMMASLLYLLTGISLPFFGIEVNNGNFLYGQFVSTGYFIGLIYFIYKVNTTINNRILISLLGFYFGLYLHASFALCYLSGSFFYFIYLECQLQSGNNFIFHKFIKNGLYGLFGALLFFTNHYTKFANALKMHNGSLGFTGFSVGAEDIALFSYVFLAICFILSVLNIYFYGFIEKFQLKYNHNLILISCFLMGFSLITCLQMIMLHMNLVSPYVVKKNLFGVFTFFIMLVVINIDLYVGLKVEKLINLKILNNYYLAPILFILMIAIFWTKSQIDLSTLMRLQKIAKDYHKISEGSPSHRNTIAQFSELSMPMNWLITIGELQVYKWSPLSTVVVHQTPNALPETAYVLTDARNDDIIDDILLQKQYRVYKSIIWNSPIKIVSGREILLNNTNPDIRNILGKGFSNPESWGTWSSEEEAEINFIVPRTTSNSLEITLVTTAWLAKGREKFVATINFNGKFVSEKEFNTTSPIVWKFDIPINNLDGNDIIKLQFHFTNPTTPALLGMNAQDNRKISIGVESIQVVF